jgi:hypothetical protein
VHAACWMRRGGLPEDDEGQGEAERAWRVGER